MAAPTPQDIEAAARILAFHRDLERVEPEEMRFGEALERLTRAIGETLGRPWVAYGEFSVLGRKEPLGVAVATQTIDGELRCTAWEGNPHDWNSGVGRDALQRALEAGNRGALQAERLWLNPVFLHGARNALFSLHHRIGSAWLSLQDHASVPARLALWALWHNDPELDHLFHGWPIPVGQARPLVQHWPWEQPNPLRPDAKWVDAVEAARELSIRIRTSSLSTIPLAVLRQRNPPSGHRKGRSLTLTEILAWYLVDQLRHDLADAATVLGMDDPRQVRYALRAAKRKHATWGSKPRALSARLP